MDPARLALPPILLSLLFVPACSGTMDEADDLGNDGGGFHVDTGGGGGDGGGGGGLDGNVGDGSGVSDSAKCGKTLTGVIRDFKSSHPDFEKFLGDDRGIVKATLGGDGKPVYASAGTTPTTTGKANFDQWYRDVPGVNQAFSFPFTLSSGGGGVYTYENNSFFPIDGKGFGDEGNPHNFHFTFELHTTFEYKGGETFRFRGDDDLWVFIDKKLVIDLGGVHGAETDQVDVDKLGLTKGGEYPLDLFFAERHTTESDFRVDTTLDFVDCGSGIK